MKKTTVLLLGTVAAVAMIGGASAAGHQHPGLSTVGAAHATKALPPGHGPAGILYDQNDNDAGTGVTSQNFESSFDIYDNQGADDFTVPGGHTWKVTEVDVTGVYYNGYGPAASENVTFYQNSHGLPGKIVAEYDNVAGVDNGSGSFAIKVPKTKLKGGASGKSYWVSVQVNMDFGVGGQWGWEIRSVQAGNLAAWQNPGDGFGSGCTTWGTLQSCIGYGPDDMFTLRGKG